MIRRLTAPSRLTAADDRVERFISVVSSSTWLDGVDVRHGRRGFLPIEERGVGEASSARLPRRLELTQPTRRLAVDRANCGRHPSGTGRRSPRGAAPQGGSNHASTVRVDRRAETRADRTDDSFRGGDSRRLGPRSSRPRPRLRGGSNEAPRQAPHEASPRRLAALGAAKGLGQTSGLLPGNKLTLESAIQVNLSNETVRLPIYPGTAPDPNNPGQ